MSHIFRSICRTTLILLSISMLLQLAACADDLSSADEESASSVLPRNVKRIIHHGQILSRPVEQLENTERAVAYELGSLHQLDARHCLLVASMDEQGGGDLCVGNDGFVIEKLSDIAAQTPIPLNRAVKNYALETGGGKAFLTKYPAVGGIIPLDQMRPNGRVHPCAGTGVLFSCGAPFRADKTTQDEDSKRVVEVIQLAWDGYDLTVTHRETISKLLDLELTGSTPIASCTQDIGLLFAFGTVEGGIVVYRFDLDGEKWVPTRRSEPFTKAHTESEASIRQVGENFYVQTRCRSTEGNLYRAGDDLDFKLVSTLQTRAGSPKILNSGLDGSLYVTCNNSPGWVRNPLMAVPWEEDHFGTPFVLHDQDGVHNDKGESSPFVDHAIASNVFLEGRWRHLVFYRVCDLKERTLHGFQLKQGFGDIVYGKGKGPIPRRPWSGMYAVEMEYANITPPYPFAP